ncbi:MAG: anti-sigma factor antagonist [Aquabacterium sp.]|jgi:anti-sigma B factor antagonist|nr:MAG: anti-sigma factor antagonist [Aquabacterium sp.]TAL19505.1 MAG: anti-sigma factor antagonist [Aquabacterium sp.]
MRIEGELSIYRAAELKAELLAAIKPKATLEVDLSGVTELDSAGVQVLMLAKRAARDLGGELKLSAHSPAVVEVFELLDLAAHFGDALLVPSA